jgi:ketosteroid isomerase-like protein
VASDFTLRSRGRDAQQLVSDHGAIEAANTRFYRAFEALDIHEMDRVWARGEHVKCVHPGWPLLVGWTAVRASWETIFANTAEMSFTISDIEVEAGAELAWVTCTENILSEVRGRVIVTSVLATNVFERDAEGWRLVHHHASHVLGQAAS